MAVMIKAGSVVLPSPVDIKASGEIIWSANTGRSSTGKMIGDVVAEKETIDISWGVLTKAQFNLIRNNMKSGFHPFTLIIDDESVTLSTYRSTLTREILGTFGGVTYYKNANVSVIEQ